MASSSGTSSAGCEEDLQQIMEQRKRKRMISNRESARRSRMRKQKHLDDLTAQVSQLRKEIGQIVTTIDATSQHYLNVEAENSILRAQVAELSHRLESLEEIINLMDASRSASCLSTEEAYGVVADEGLWNFPYFNQPIMACADMLQY